MLALGFFLGLRHATDSDHVMAVFTIVSRERSLRGAALIGALWGIGHTLTVLLVGGAIVAFGVTIPPRLGLGMEFCVGLMLVLLGVLNLRAKPRGAVKVVPTPGTLRPLFIGIVHGLAGSAAIVLLVLPTIRSTAHALAHLLVYGVGTIAGMSLITLAMAAPLAASARRFERMNAALVVATGVASVLFGSILMYQIGVVHGLFGGSPQWTPG